MFLHDRHGTLIMHKLEPSSIARLPDGSIASFAVWTHELDGHAHFDFFHLAAEYEEDSIFDLAFAEIDDAFDDLFLHRIQDHPYLTAGKGAVGFGLGGFNAAKAAQLARLHPTEYRNLILRASTRGALHWMLVPYLPFFIAKHVQHAVDKRRRGSQHLVDLIYLKSNGGDRMYQNAPWK